MYGLEVTKSVYTEFMVEMVRFESGERYHFHEWIITHTGRLHSLYCFCGCLRISPRIGGKRFRWNGCRSMSWLEECYKFLLVFHVHYLVYFLRYSQLYETSYNIDVDNACQNKRPLKLFTNRPTPNGTIGLSPRRFVSENYNDWLKR